MVNFIPSIILQVSGHYGRLYISTLSEILFTVKLFEFGITAYKVINPYTLPALVKVVVLLHTPLILIFTASFITAFYLQADRKFFLVVHIQKIIR